jgi:hypothetical protein
MTWHHILAVHVVWWCLILGCSVIGIPRQIVTTDFCLLPNPLEFSGVIKFHSWFSVLALLYCLWINMMVFSPHKVSDLYIIKVIMINVLHFNFLSEYLLAWVYWANTSENQLWLCTLFFFFPTNYVLLMTSWACYRFLGVYLIMFSLRHAKKITQKLYEIRSLIH